MDPPENTAASRSKTGAEFTGIAQSQLTTLLISSCALVLANLVPLAGVVFLKWDAFTVLALFWLENVVIGVESVLRMALAQQVASPFSKFGKALRQMEQNNLHTTKLRQVLTGNPKALPVIKLMVIPFFLVHFGIFTLVHGGLLLMLFGEGQAAAGIASTSFLAAFLGLVASHGTSFLSDYVRGGKYRTSSLEAEMKRPYGRVVVMHLTVIGGAFLIGLSGGWRWPVALLVTLKTAVDLAAHVRQLRLSALQH